VQGFFAAGSAFFHGKQFSQSPIAVAKKPGISANSDFSVHRSSPSALPRGRPILGGGPDPVAAYHNGAP